jgi:membrane protein YdbS with pleckstrin-like domain
VSPSLRPPAPGRIRGSPNVAAMLAFNLALVFALEIAASVALAVVGAELGGVVLAIAFPVVAAVLWGLFAAPKARWRGWATT